MEWVVSNGLIINYGNQNTPVKNAPVTLPKVYTTSHFITLTTFKAEGWNGYPNMCDNYTLTTFTYHNANTGNHAYVWLSMGI